MSQNVSPRSSFVVSSDPAIGDAGTGDVSPGNGVDVKESKRRRGRKSAEGRVTVGFWVALGVISLLVVSGIFADVLAPHDPLRGVIADRNASPSTQYLLGTDGNGRDVLSRLLFGARSAMGATTMAILVAAAIGVPWGLVSGYFGGRLDEVLMRIADSVIAFPALVLAVAITGALGPDLTNAMIAIGVVFAPVVARLLRSTALPLREAEYVLVAGALGVGRLKVALRHVLPNAMAPVLVQLCAMASLGLIIEASLNFLGLGAQLPAPSWGADLATAYLYFHSAPWATLAPGLVITIAAFSLSRLGDGLRVILQVE